MTPAAIRDDCRERRALALREMESTTREAWPDVKAVLDAFAARLDGRLASIRRMTRANVARFGGQYSEPPKALILAEAIALVRSIERPADGAVSPAALLDGVLDL